MSIAPTSAPGTSFSTGLLDPTTIRVHDVRPGFRHLSNNVVRGLARYSDRALLLPGLSVVHTGVPASYLEFLDRVGIGAPPTGGVMEVSNGPSLIDRMTTQQRTTIMAGLLGGSKLEVFYPTALEKALLNGLCYQDYVWGPTPQLAASLDKAWLRRFVAQHPLLGIEFPDHGILAPDDETGIALAARQLVTITGEIVVKDPGLATGDGMIRLKLSDPTFDTCVQLAVRKLATSNPELTEVIIEPWYERHIALSAQLEINDLGPVLLAHTINRIANGTVHQGNIICSGDLPGIPAEIVELMESRCLALAELFCNIGYRGHLGFDVMYLPESGLLLFLEVNGRATGAMYPLALAQQAADHGLTNWTVISDNLETGRPINWQKLEAELRIAHLLFDGQVGIMPVCVPLLEKGKAMLYSIAGNPRGAELFLGQARAILAAA